MTVAFSATTFYPKFCYFYFMAGIIITIVLLGLLVWLLLAPLYLYIHTGESRYEAGLTGFFKARLVNGKHGLPELKMRVLFYPFRMPLIRLGEDRKKPSKAIKKQKKSKKRSWQGFRKIKLIMKISWKLVRSFRLKKFYLNVDTGNVITNAYLFPVFSVLGGKKYRLSVNYASKNELILRLENNLMTIFSHIVVQFIKHQLKR